MNKIITKPIDFHVNELGNLELPVHGYNNEIHYIEVKQDPQTGLLRSVNNDPFFLELKEREGIQEENRILEIWTPKQYNDYKIRLMLETKVLNGIVNVNIAGKNLSFKVSLFDIYARERKMSIYDLQAEKQDGRFIRYNSLNQALKSYTSTRYNVMTLFKEEVTGKTLDSLEKENHDLLITELEKDGIYIRDTKTKKIGNLTLENKKLDNTDYIDLLECLIGSDLRNYIPYSRSGKYDKGGIGKAIELAIGLELNNRPEADTYQGEIKSYSVKQKGDNSYEPKGGQMALAMIDENKIMSTPKGREFKSTSIFNKNKVMILCGVEEMPDGARILRKVDVVDLNDSKYAPLMEMFQKDWALFYDNLHSGIPLDGSQGVYLKTGPKGGAGTKDRAVYLRPRALMRLVVG